MKHTEYLKYEFTDVEITEAARDLARSTQHRSTLEQKKKDVDAGLKGEIEAENSKIGRLSFFINTGFEYRDVECRVELDTPEAGRKRIVRIDSGEEVKVVPMTDADRQIALDLQEKADAAENVIVTEPPTLLRIEGGAIEGTVEATPFERDSKRRRHTNGIAEVPAQ